MIKSKQEQQQYAQTYPSTAIGANDTAMATHTTMGTVVTMQEAYDINPMEDMLLACQEILTKYLLVDNDGKIYIRQKDEYIDPERYRPFFRTIQVENGQVDRLIANRFNYEGVVPLPGVFHHFVDMHWDVGAENVGTCKAIYRMKVVLNNLNIEDYDTQMYIYRVAQAIIRVFNEHKSEYSAFTTRFQLDYLDPMETWTRGIQYFWLQYSVQFQDYTTYTYKNYIEKHVVAAPFTNHSDQLPESNEDNHEDHTEYTYDEASTILEPDGTENIPIHT